MNLSLSFVFLLVFLFCFVSFCPSPCLSLCLSVGLFHRVYCFSIGLFLRVFLSFSVSFCLYLCLSVFLCVCGERRPSAVCSRVGVGSTLSLRLEPSESLPLPFNTCS